MTSDDQVRFAAGLYQGTAGYYDRYRLPYPEALVTDLVRRAAPSGHGRLLDLACGTGQLAFPLLPWFSEAWAVDREPGMVDAVRAQAAATGAVRPAAATPSASSRRPGTLSWPSSATRSTASTATSLPRQRRPDHEVLSAAGFDAAGRAEFTAEHRWTGPELAGFIRATSALPPAVRGDRAPAFGADLAASVGRYGDGGVFTQTVSFACELARKPA